MSLSPTTILTVPFVGWVDNLTRLIHTYIGNGDGDGDGIEDGIGEGGAEGNKRKKRHNNCSCDVRDRRDLGVTRKKRRQERVGSVSADRDNLENSKKKAGSEAQDTQGLSKNCRRRESVPPSSRPKFSGANGEREIFIFPVQLTTSSIGNLTQLI